MRPILAILADSVRQLRARRLFWFVLGISLIIVVGFGSIGFNDKGITYLYGLKQIETPFFVAGSMYSRMLMDVIFSVFIVNLWLAWGAIILAIVSTCGIFPDFLADGSIDLVLAKPISRTRIFLTKYVGSLAFVFLQVLIFCVGVLLVFGFRLDEWRWKVLLAVPMITLMFSYLYAITVFMNVWTRSVLPSLIVTMVVWIGIWGIQSANGIVQMMMTNCETAVEMSENRIADQQKSLDEAKTQDNPMQINEIERNIRLQRQTIGRAQQVIDTLGPYAGLSDWISNVAPKTGETVSLVQRWLEADSSMTFGAFLSGEWVQQENRNASGNGQRGPGNGPDFLIGDREIRMESMKRYQQQLDRRSAWFIIGSSLAFEFVLVSLACIMFTRQDF